MEIWKDINGFVGVYQISNYGRVKSLSRKINNRYGLFISKEKIKVQSLDTRGYPQILLLQPGLRKTIKIHLLVWDHFGNQPRDGRNINVDHKDEVKTNNHISNLQVLKNRDNKNKSLSKNGRLNGVTFRPNNRFTSEIYVNGKRNYLGVFKSEIEAHNAYMDARKKYNV